MTLIAKHLSDFNSPTTLPPDSGKESGSMIYLNCGEPDFLSPYRIQEGAVEAIKKKFTNYTQVEGTIELRNAICRKLLKENNLEYEPSQIIVSNGAKQVIYNALMASLDSNDEVIIPAPYWVSYPSIVCLGRGKPKTIICSESSRFKILPKDLDKAITKYTKWFIFNNPNNPTGAVYNKKEVEDLVSVLKNHPHVNILSDEVYEHINFTADNIVSMAQICNNLKERTLVVNSVSKTYAMTGWRIGYGASYNKSLIKTMIAIQAHSTSNPCSISQVSAEKALDGDLSFLKDSISCYDERKKFLATSINNINNLSCIEPEGGIFVYVNCKNVINKKTQKGQNIFSDCDFVYYLKEKAKICVTSGKEFGCSPYFRVSFATSIDKIKEALSRLKEATECLQ